MGCRLCFVLQWLSHAVTLFYRLKSNGKYWLHFSTAGWIPRCSSIFLRRSSFDGPRLGAPEAASLSAAAKSSCVWQSRSHMVELNSTPSKLSAHPTWMIWICCYWWYAQGSEICSNIFLFSYFLLVQVSSLTVNIHAYSHFPTVDLKISPSLHFQC